MSDQHLSKDLLDHGHRIAQLELKVAELERRLGQGEPTAGEGLTFASDAQAGRDLFDHPRMAELLRSGNKLEAIKLYREINGVGLKEAKDPVDAMS